ncbi:MAG: PTS transporter subunit EIIC [Thomasclavelia ramosa]
MVLLMCRSKSKHISSIGRLSIVPGICGINEPIMFGAPIVLIQFIDTVFSNAVLIGLGYLVQKLD